MDGDGWWRRLTLSVVIPVYNEADNLPALLQEIDHALNGQLSYELLVVNDGSNDNTQEKLCQLQLQYPQLKIIRHLENRGQSIAIISGVKHAVTPWIATLDGDGQNDPRDILTLFKQVESFDPYRDVLLVTGIRSIRRDNRLRRGSSRLANFIRQILFRDGCPDAGSGLKIFPRQVFLNLPHFDHMHRFLPALVKRANGTLINIPVNHRRRVSGRTKYGVWNRLWISIVDILGVRWLLSRDVNVDVEVLSSRASKTKRKSKINARAIDTNKNGDKNKDVVAGAKNKDAVLS